MEGLRLCKPRDGIWHVSGSVTKNTINNGFIYLHDACMHIHEVHFDKILIKKKGFDLFTTNFNTTFKDPKPMSLIPGINTYRRYVDMRSRVVSVNIDDLYCLK